MDATKLTDSQWEFDHSSTAADATVNIDIVCNYQKHILSLMKNSFGSAVDTDDVKVVLENLLRLEIYYKEFNYEEIVETPGYTVLTL